MVAPLDVGLIPHYLDALELMQRATTRLAAQNRTNGDLERIRKAEAIFADAVNQRQLQEMINGNYDYHIAIAQAGGNPYFTALYSRLLNEGKRMLHMHFSFATESKARGVDTLLLEHAAITRAIEEQDFELAERLAYVHSVEFRKRFTQYLERNATQDIRLGEQAYAKPPVKNTRTRRAALGRRD
jgi:DNA-binding GntR family transcriptional regulator